MIFHNHNNDTTAPSETEIQLLADDLVQFADSPQTRNLYLKAINALGPGLVREAMGEVRMRDRDSGLQGKAAYLTTVLINWMKEKGLYQSPSTSLVSEPIPAVNPKMTTIDEFIPIQATNLPLNFQGESREMDVPYSRDLFQWASHIGNEFFTLTNETAKTDRVFKMFEVGGLQYKVPMLRGKLFREDKEERKIPTTEHMRVLHAIEAIWSSRRGPHDIDQKGFLQCKVLVPVNEIAQYLGVNKGGKNYQRIKERAVDLATTGYVFLTKDLPGFTRNGKTLEDYPFTFFAEAKPMNIRDNETGKTMAYLRIVFSEQYSYWLLHRRVLNRPLELLQKRGDIAFKLAVYLFPILMKRGEHSIELDELIDRLGLKRTGWSAPKGYKSQRKREFEKAVRELDGLPTGEGRVFSLQIAQGLNKADFILDARLKSP